MIVDTIDNAKLYCSMGREIHAVLEFFLEYDAEKHEPGDVRLSDAVLVKRWIYKTAAGQDIKLEAHRKFIDVMYLAGGEEKLLYLPKAAVSEAADGYDCNADVIFAGITPEVSQCRLSKGQFAILFPQDYHHAGSAWGQSCQVAKLIAKVAIPAADR